MLTIEDLKSEVDTLRELLTMSDSDEISARNLLKSQMQLMIALHETQNELNDTLKHHAAVLGQQGLALGSMVLAMNDLQLRVGSLDKSLLQFRRNTDRRFKGIEREIGGLRADVADLRTEDQNAAGSE
ncbi:MAG: hypothetical protein ABSA93_12270 [Streptosporangiaceae bacterium]|jgi:hypothetical protein